MALPAVLRMFNSARKDSFTNEVNTVLRTARQQYLLSGGTDTTWSNVSGSTNTLSLTGNSRLTYYVKMNNEGKVTKLQVSNGDYQYNVTNNANCRFNVSWSCGAAGLKSEYANSTNPAGKIGTYAEPRPYVYDENAVNIYPVINAYMDKIGSTSEINVSGRLLSYEEAKVLDRNITKDMNNYNYWSGSAESCDTAYTISYYGYIGTDYANAPRSIRPVIVISTSDMPK